MALTLQKSSINKSSAITITGSKSESNRLLLLQALYPQLTIDNLSNADDTRLMQQALQSQASEIDVHHAGTAMRFLTAYYATIHDSTVTITGSSRMKERPIKILVDALRDLGADISYLENEGFPPLQIKPARIDKCQVSLQANVSSQYISALLLIAPQLPQGLELTLIGKITSVPYIKMTLALLNDIGVTTSFKDNVISVSPLNTQNVNAKTLTVESDWSSASYFYSLVALSPVGASISLSAYKAASLQGDSCLAKLYQDFGVETTFNATTITICKQQDVEPSKTIQFNLSNAPDIAQTIAVTAFGLGMACNLTGLHTLKIKETDRIVALQTELEKLGAKVTVTDESLHLQTSNTIIPSVAIDTYNDHRMAMAFAPLVLKTDIIINDAEVVSKSYPDFWNDFKQLGCKLSE